MIDDGGMHRIVGRESVDLIKSGGYRVGAGEIETVLLGHPGVSEAAVVGLPDDDLGQRIVAFIVGDAEPDALINYVAEQLSVHKRPREVRVVDSLPRNAMGKVLKKELADWAKTNASEDRSEERARTGASQSRACLKFDEICIDAHDATALGEWWAGVLGWPHDIDEDGDVRLHPPPGQGPHWIFIAVPDDKVVKNRIHLDFKADDQQAEVDRVIGLGRTTCRHRPDRRRKLGGASRPRGQRVLHPRARRLTSAPRACANYCANGVSSRRHCSYVKRRQSLRGVAVSGIVMQAVEEGAG